MAHRLNDEAGVTRALAIGIRMTPAEIAQGRYMRGPDHPASRSEAVADVTDFIAEQFLGGADEPVEEEEDPEGEEPEGEEAEGDDPDANTETNDEDDGEAPEPIAAPVSWDKDAKERFAQLPIEDQQYIADREAQREKAIQSATTEAANAKRNAVVEANAVFAEQQRQYASHLEQIAARQAPQAPDPNLAFTDPGAYVQQQALYQHQNAQHQEMVQQAMQVRQEADQRDAITRQYELQETHRLMGQELGDTWTDPVKRQALLTDFETVGAALGYTPELINQATATDLLALKAASEWKVKAEKYDKLQGTRMEAVRANIGKPRVNKPGTASTRAERTGRGQDAAFDRLKQSRGKDGDAAAAFLESAGIKL